MELLSAESLVALLTLTALEIVLGIDNIVFISILSDRLPPPLNDRARVVGLALAMLMRIGLLFTLSIVIGLTAPLFTLLGQEISGRDLILISGGLFLIAKATIEIHDSLEGSEGHAKSLKSAPFRGVILQILLLDIVFSLDSVITAVGMVDELVIMVMAVVIAVGVMLVAAKPLSEFVGRHPTVKMLALSFLLLIGLALVADGLEIHIPKGYIYFAMGFSVFVELLNLRLRGRRAAPVHLHATYGMESDTTDAAGHVPESGRPTG